MFRLKTLPTNCIRPLISIKWLNYASEAPKPQERNPIHETSTTLSMSSSDASSTVTQMSQGPSTAEIKSRKVDYIVNPPDMFIKVEHLEPIPESEAMRKSLSFDEVPGPKALRHLAKFWSFVPVMGTQVTASAIQYLLSAGKIFGSQLSWGSNLWLFSRLLDEYGPVVRLHGPFGGDVVILSRPEHASAVFQNEGRYPVRSSLDCVEKYRLQFRRYKQAGPFLMYGPDWEKLRELIEPCLQNCIVQQYDQIEKSCDEFTTRILRIRNRQEEVPPTFRNEIYKWAMECMCSVTLNRRLGFLDPCGLSATSEPARLLEGLNGATDAIRRCESGLHLWKFIETPAWKDLVKHCDIIDTIVNKYIHKAQDSLRQKKSGETVFIPENVSLLETLLIKEGMLPEDVLTVILDMMLIGVNAISHSIAFLIYHLARNPRAQRKLYGEIRLSPTQLGRDDLPKMTYLQACIKESLRLKPPMPILSRVLSKDILVHNYRIPKGTYILIATHLSSLREEHFEDAQRFKPDRWLDSDMQADTSVFASLPYGHGPKACLARELAEMEIALVIVKLLRKFRIEYHYGDINSTHRLLASPDRPLKFRFVDRF
ncbi:hypothetical protein ILUMI_17121 [Ignelater luminosus]|uniref:Cytochrome P450 n=1 Tax=Ignelater luminosus TaxID=2038154 RepID=A0A8K0CPP1_IGNLU|nr:hypothetical protein ILUMI_17121 [Ignelater luminosus]